MELSPDLNALLRSFHDHHVEYIVVGAHALAYHGVPRFTGDLDLLVQPTADNAQRILAALESFGFGGLGLTTDDFTQPDTVIQLGNPPARVDILTAISGVDWETAATGATPGTIADLPVRYLGKNELIVNKRATGRIKDLADIEALGE